MLEDSGRPECHSRCTAATERVCRAQLDERGLPWKQIELDNQRHPGAIAERLVRGVEEADSDVTGVGRLSGIGRMNRIGRRHRVRWKDVHHAESRDLQASEADQTEARFVNARYDALGIRVGERCDSRQRNDTDRLLHIGSSLRYRIRRNAMMSATS